MPPVRNRRDLSPWRHTPLPGTRMPARAGRSVRTSFPTRPPYAGSSTRPICAPTTWCTRWAPAAASSTGALAKAGGQVIAYEVDPRMAAAIPAQHGVVVRAGGLPAGRTDPGEPFAGGRQHPLRADLRGRRLVPAGRSLRNATLLTQLEYARKRTGDYGRWSRLTIRTWPEFDWWLAGRVARTSFRPVPRVDGGILRLARRDAPLVPPDALIRTGVSSISASPASAARCRRRWRGATGTGGWPGRSGRSGRAGRAGRRGVAGAVADAVPAVVPRAAAPAPATSVAPHCA